MFQVQNTSPTRDLQVGHITVGTTPVQILNNNSLLVRGLLVRAPGAGDLIANTDVIFIGKKSVSCVGVHGTVTDGFPLLPGGALELQVDDGSAIYAVSRSENQDLAYVAL